MPRSSHVIKHYISFATIAIIAILCFIMAYEFSWKGNDGKGYTKVIDGDGKGYYLYLTNIFINKSISSQEPDDRFILNLSGKGVNKYFAGTAIAISPFFGLGYLIAFLQNDKLDGYSFPFQSAMCFAALFYLLVGLLFLRQLLKLYNICETTICIILVFLSFGTNLLVYTVLEPSMSHVYSFAFISAFLYFIKKLFVSGRSKYLYLSSAVFALVILIRPVNSIIIFLIPFLAGSFENLKSIFIINFKAKRIILGSLVFICLLSIQMGLWYVQTGKFIIWSYKDEGFYFSQPHLWDFLFSFRKGFFIYTPMAFLSLFGMLFFWERQKFAFFTLLFFFIIVFYFLSSWWCWYYGPSFGQRVMVEFYPIFALLLALLLEKPKSLFIKTVILIIAIMLMTFNLIQAYQYQKQIISSWDMNFNKYKYTFLRTSSEFYECLGGNNDILPYKSEPKLIFHLNQDFEKEYDFCLAKNIRTEPVKRSKVCDFSGLDFNAMVKLPVNKKYLGKRALFAEIELTRLEIDQNACSKALMVINISDTSDNNYFYYRFIINETPTEVTGEWEKMKYFIEIPSLRDTTDKMSIYIWNPNKKSFIIDDFNVKLYSIL